jgi:hypothetical protein
MTLLNEYVTSIQLGEEELLLKVKDISPDQDKGIIEFYL